MESLEEGRKQFAAIHQSITKLTVTVDSINARLEENTVLTNRAVDLATKTADDTAVLVEISRFGTKITKFGRFVASTVAVCTQALSALSKVLVPILILYAIVMTLLHGDKLSWKEILDWVKQVL